jgi:hypothetical protein
MSNKFQEYKQLDLSQINKEVLKRWQEDDTFHKSISTREGHPTFVFYEGTAFGQWNAGNPSCDGPRNQRYFLPLQNHERFSRSSQSRLGHTWFAC